jgi:hypothetical protein
MTFGLRNAGNTFQRYMDRVLSGLDFIFVNLDDIIIAARGRPPRSVIAVASVPPWTLLGGGPLEDI